MNKKQVFQVYKNFEEEIAALESRITRLKALCEEMINELRPFGCIADVFEQRLKDEGVVK